MGQLGDDRVSAWVLENDATARLVSRYRRIGVQREQSELTVDGVWCRSLYQGRILRCNEELSSDRAVVDCIILCVTSVSHISVVDYTAEGMTVDRHSLHSELTVRRERHWPRAHHVFELFERLAHYLYKALIDARILNG